MKQTEFDLVMNYIDDYILEDTDTIKHGILNLIGIDSYSFGKFFSVLTGDTLGSYIRRRRLYHAAMDLQNNKQKPIFDIALDHGYSDQSSFTRAFTGEFEISPNELRSNSVFHVIQNNKYKYIDFDDRALNSRSHQVMREFERTGFLFSPNVEFLKSIEYGHTECGFDIDTCYLIADLSEKLKIPASVLMNSCFDLAADIKSEPDYLANDNLAAIDLGIRSHEDLEQICHHYACKYYELNSHMVDSYYAAQN